MSQKSSFIVFLHVHQSRSRGILSEKIPAFTKGRTQLSILDVEPTRKLAHVRIHVERVIGLVPNKYKMLQDTVPLVVLFSPNDKISK